MSQNYKKIPDLRSILLPYAVLPRYLSSGFMLGGRAIAYLKNVQSVRNISLPIGLQM